MKTIELPFVKKLSYALREKSPLIQVVLGPRQVGKTTGVQQVITKNKAGNTYYISADGPLLKAADWIFGHWELAKSKSENCLLVIDEIQKIEDWSEAIKKLWDEQKNKKQKLKLVLLGSSSLSIQKGLSESLAGRYQVHKIYHWDFDESKQICSMSWDRFLVYGGYPGSYAFIKKREAWLDYLKDSIINPVIAKDILTQVRVKSPALFKQCFEIVCSYPAQEISYTKLLGQLQDRGNTDLIKYYLELFEAAFLIKQLFKYSPKKVLSRTSSPKILPLCPALYSVGLDGDLNKSEFGRSFELAIGARLVRLPGALYYWRERNYEVDYVYQYGKKLFGIEVKYGKSLQAKGLMKFKEKFPHAETMIITPDSYTQSIKKIL
jgi:uncharacterized protein